MIIVFTRYCLLFAVGCTFLFACSSSRKTKNLQQGQTVTGMPVSNITLYGQPLDTIKKYVVDIKWQMVYSIGGITGNDSNTFTGLYYTLLNNGTLVKQDGKEVVEQPYRWEKARDIYTGDSTYVITGVVQWKVEGIHHDTLQLSDNYTDGYRYALIRAK